MTKEELELLAIAVKQETVEGANSSFRIGNLFKKFIDYIHELVDPLQNIENNESISILLADKVSISAQSLTPTQQARVRANIGVTETGGTVVNNEMVVSETAPDGEVLEGKKWFSLATGEEFNRVGDVWITD